MPAGTCHRCGGPVYFGSTGCQTCRPLPASLQMAYMAMDAKEREQKKKAAETDTKKEG